MSKTAKYSQRQKEGLLRFYLFDEHRIFDDTDGNKKFLEDDLFLRVKDNIDTALYAILTEARENTKNPLESLRIAYNNDRVLSFINKKGSVPCPEREQEIDQFLDLITAQKKEWDEKGLDNACDKAWTIIDRKREECMTADEIQRGLGGYVKGYQ